MVALWNAVSKNNIECVCLLAPVSIPWACNSKAVYMAYLRGYWKCVEILRPFSDKTIMNKIDEKMRNKL